MGRIRNIAIGLFIAFLPLVMAGGRHVLGSPSMVLLNVQEAEVAWADPGLFEKLKYRLINDLDMRVVRAIGNGERPPFPTDRRDTDSLINWAAEVGGRYLMVVTIHSERLERKKTFSIPLIFHKYETVGIINGEIALYDVARGRCILSELIDMELEAARVFQIFEDDALDASINLSASQKVTFIDKLERKLAEKLAKHVQKVLKKS